MYKHFLTLFLLFFSSLIIADNNLNIVRPDGHAPISIMGDHVHKDGEFMWSYRYMTMDMAGVLNGESAISLDSYSSDTSYMRYLDSMTMKMHMLGAMYAQSDKLTWMLMLPYIENNMVVQATMGGAYSSMSSSGIGDAKIGGLYSLVNTESIKSHVNLMMSLPLGAIDLTDGGMTLGYAMQLGSGTYDLRPSWTSVINQHNFSLGAQANAVIRTGENEQSYRLGNEYNLKSWFAKSFGHFSVSTSLIYDSVGAIVGDHAGIMSVMNAAQDSANSGLEQVTATVGVNVALNNGYRFAFEVLNPLYQNVTGYQMSNETSVVFGLQKAY